MNRLDAGVTVQELGTFTAGREQQLRERPPWAGAMPGPVSAHTHRRLGTCPPWPWPPALSTAIRRQASAEVRNACVSRGLSTDRTGPGNQKDGPEWARPPWGSPGAITSASLLRPGGLTGISKNETRQLPSSAPRGRLLRKGPGRTRPAVGFRQGRQRCRRPRLDKDARTARLPQAQRLRFSSSPHSVMLQRPGV